MLTTRRSVARLTFERAHIRSVTSQPSSGRVLAGWDRSDLVSKADEWGRGSPRSRMGGIGSMRWITTPPPVGVEIPSAPAVPVGMTSSGGDVATASSVMDTNPRASDHTTAAPPPAPTSSHTAPRSPSSSPPPRTTNHSPRKIPYSRTYRLARALAVLSGLTVVGYELDRRFYASALRRSLRTAWAGTVTTIDFKLNFTPSNAEAIEALHQRVADRLYATITANAGLYVKMGQAIGLQAALLPKPYKDAFSGIFDNAPSIPVAEIERVFREDLGKDPLEVFRTFADSPIAAASIAQVHVATIDRHEVLRDSSGHVIPGGGRRWTEKVAVKVQRPAIKLQMEWDLWSYKKLMVMTEWLFEMPMSFVADYVAKQMRLETSFLNEMSNARRCADYLAATPELRDKVYVPKVYPEVASSDRVMVMEYVEGCKITDKAQIEAWGFSPREVMDIAIETSSAMCFDWGFVHCDPHPGNILVRPHPANNKKPQVVLLDHGLYIDLPKKFQREYCTLWRSLFTFDIPAIEHIAKQWGIGLDVNMFASAILLRPTKVDNKPLDSGQKSFKQMDQYEREVDLKRKIKTALENEALVPRELIFLGRNQRIIQAVNQMLGSPSPRVNITAKWASRGYAKFVTSHEDRSLTAVGVRPWVQDQLRVLAFKIALAGLDVAFLTTRVRQWWYRGTSRGNKGWEDDLQKQFEEMAKNEFGIELDDTVFLA